MGNKGFLGVTIGGFIFIAAVAIVGMSLLSKKAGSTPAPKKELVGGVSPLDLPGGETLMDRGFLNLRREEVTEIIAKSGTSSGLRITEGGMLDWSKAFDVLDATELVQNGLAVPDQFQAGAVVHPAAAIAAASAGTNLTEVTGTSSNGVPQFRTEHNASYYDAYWG